MYSEPDSVDIMCLEPDSVWQYGYREEHCVDIMCLKPDSVWQFGYREPDSVTITAIKEPNCVDTRDEENRTVLTFWTRIMRRRWFVGELYGIELDSVGRAYSENQTVLTIWTSQC